MRQCGSYLHLWITRTILTLQLTLKTNASRKSHKLWCTKIIRRKASWNPMKQENWVSNISILLQNHHQTRLIPDIKSIITRLLWHILGLKVPIFGLCSVLHVYATTYISRILEAPLDLDENGEGGSTGILPLPEALMGYEVFFSWLLWVFCFFLPSSSALPALLVFRFFAILLPLLDLLLLFVSLFDVVFALLFTATSFFSLFFAVEWTGGDFQTSFGEDLSETVVLFLLGTGFETPLLTVWPTVLVSVLGCVGVCWNGKWEEAVLG